MDKLSFSMNKSIQIDFYRYARGLTFVKDDGGAKQYVIVRGPEEMHRKFLGMVPLPSVKYWEVSYSVHTSRDASSGLPPSAKFNIFLGRKPRVEVGIGNSIDGNYVRTAEVCLDIIWETLRRGKMGSGGDVWSERNLTGIVNALDGFVKVSKVESDLLMAHERNIA